MNYISHLSGFFRIARRDSRLTASHVSLYMALFQVWNNHRFQNPITIHREMLMQFSKIGSKNTYHKCLKELHAAGYLFHHPRPSRFAPVNISMVRLDQKKDQIGSPQLDLFAAGSSCGIMQFEDTPGLKTDTDAVPNLVPSSIKNGTGTVPNLGHSYKLNNKQLNSVCKTPTKIFNKNEPLSKAIDELLDSPPEANIVARIDQSPGLQQIQEFFLENNFPGSEAEAFFHYNEGKDWMLTPKLKIRNWQALAHKWMLNEPKHKRNCTINSNPAADGQNKDFEEPL